jgi:hypothetical protein
LPIKKSLYKELLMFSIFGNIKRSLIQIIICSFIVGVLYIIVIYLITTLYKKTLVK